LFDIFATRTDPTNHTRSSLPFGHSSRSVRN
jgi:hypothetical protein